MYEYETRLLRSDFMKLDLNGDGRVDKHELSVHLSKRGITDESHRQEIVETIFQQCDQDNSGTIEIEEFVQRFIGIRRELVEKGKILE